MTAAEHFQAGRRDLIVKRDEIIKMIETVDAMLASLKIIEDEVPKRTGVSGTVVRSKPTPAPSAESGPTIREALTAGMQDGGEYPFKELMGILRAAGNDSTEQSVRGVVAKLEKKGYFVKVRPAVFRLPKNDEGPADAGPSQDLLGLQGGGGPDDGASVAS